LRGEGGLCCTRGLEGPLDELKSTWKKGGGQLVARLAGTYWGNEKKNEIKEELPVGHGIESQMTGGQTNCKGGKGNIAIVSRGSCRWVHRIEK